ncbi:MAG: tRNA lysidine(34) synthetase TilS [Ignavibacteria bacterium]|nr:tRNA lysidine(34) synthetase TilS [Ignavibacteria bacterium]
MKKIKNIPQRDKIIKIKPKSLGTTKINFPLGKVEKMFISKFRDILSNVLFIEPKSRILIAVSGGIDSVCLLDAFYAIYKQFEFELAIAHLNHQLRGSESDRDENFVKSLSEDYNLMFFLQRVNIREFSRKMSMSVEEAARIVRYDFLRRAAQSFSARYVATAHNLNDQAETVLLNLIRGTGIAGLRGIANKMELTKNIFLIRPFLTFSRREIEEYANERGLIWCEDSTNQLTDYTRNKIRLQLVPFLEKEFNPQIVSNLGKLANIAQNGFNIISNYVKKFSEQLIFSRNKNEVELDLESFIHYDESIFGDLVQYVCNTFFHYSLNFQQIEDLRKLVYAETGKFLVISREIFVYKNRQKLCFIRREKWDSAKEVSKISKVGYTFWKRYLIEFEEVTLSDFIISTDKSQEFFDYDKIGEEIIIRCWEEGDRFTPLGMKKSKKLSDFFIDEKISLPQKENIPIFLSNNEIFWVGGIRISEKYKITKRTRRILKGKITLINKDG